MSVNDDFYISNEEALHECNYLTSILKSQIVLTTGGIASVLCYLYLFYMYFIAKSPILKRHPTTLAVYRSIFEFVFVQQYLWLPSLNSRLFYDESALEKGNCRATALAGFLAFVSQFSLLGGEVWFFVISLDLRLAYTNPFASYKKSRLQYFFLVFFIATLTAFILLAFGPDSYGVSPEGVVWIQNRHDYYSSTHPNVCKIIVFYAWMFGIYVYCVWAIWRLTFRLKKGFAETLGMKISIIERARVYVVSYTVYWGCLLLLEFLSFAFHGNPASRVLVTIVAYLFCFRGVWSLAIILYTNRSDLSWATLSPFHSQKRNHLVETCVKEGLLLKPHLNSALRTEILYFTTQGIMFAAIESDKMTQSLVESTRNTNGSVAQDQTRKSLQADRLSFTAAIDLLNGIVGRTSSSAPIETNQFNTYNFKDLIPKRSSGANRDVESQSDSSISEISSLSSNGSTLRDINTINENQIRAVAVEELEAAEHEAEQLGLLDVYDKINDSSNANNEDVEGNNGVSTVRNRQPFADKRRSNRFSVKGILNRLSLNRRREVSIDSLESKSSQDNSKITPTFELSSRGASSQGSSFGKPIKNPLARTLRNEEYLKHDEKDNSSTSSQSSSSIGAFHVNRIRESTGSRETFKWKSVTDFSFQLRRDTGQSSVNETTNLEGRNRSSTDVWQKFKDRFFSVGSRPSDSTPASAEDVDQPRGDRTNSFETFSKLIRSVTVAATDLAQAAFNTDYDEFKFKDYQPLRFARLRKMFGVSATEYANAFIKTTKETFSEGRSGAFLFYSSDQRFIAKTTSKEDIVSLQRILKSYEEYLSVNPHSLLIRFLGDTMICYVLHAFSTISQQLIMFNLSRAHRITMYGQDIHFVVMGNVFPPTKLSERYDLKGSWVKRHRLAAARKSSGSKTNITRRRVSDRGDGSTPLLFDNDIQQKITLSSNVTKFLTAQIFKDVTFLRDQGLMDYSLLVGVKRQRFDVSKHLKTDTKNSINDINMLNPSSNPYQKQPDGGINAAVVEGPGIFYFGIIDVLQEWNWSKKLERFFKVNILGYDGDGLSAIEPTAYASRFLNGAVLDFFDGIDEASTESYKEIIDAGSFPLRQLYRRSVRGSVINIPVFMNGSDSPSSTTSSTTSENKTNGIRPKFGRLGSLLLGETHFDNKNEGSETNPSDDTTYVMNNDRQFLVYEKRATRSSTVTTAPRRGSDTIQNDSSEKIDKESFTTPLDDAGSIHVPKENDSSSNHSDTKSHG